MVRIYALATRTLPEGLRVLFGVASARLQERIFFCDAEASWGHVSVLACIL